MCAIIRLRLKREANLTMIVKNRLKTRLVKLFFGVFLIMMSLIGGVIGVNPGNHSAYAISEDEPVPVNVVEEASDTTEATEEQTVDEITTEVSTPETISTGNVGGNGCQRSLGSIGWLVCPITDKISEAVDWLYDKIEDVLAIDPIPSEDGAPIYEIWKYCRGLTNIVFIIFLLVVVYSQITGHGINNYGIKRVLPKLIVAALMVNLSFLICSLAVDASNIIGNGIRGLFTTVAESANIGGVAEATGDISREMKMSYANIYSSLAGGTALAVGAGAIAFETGAIWMLIPTVLGAIVAVGSGLITIALRQAVVALLIMISPLAMVANILPNTEQWFRKWKNLLYKMLIFYPTFSLLFGASQLAGFAIIASAKDGFGLLLGMAVQIFPLFFSWSLMRMSGTFLDNIYTKIRGLTAAPLAMNRGWAESHRAQTRAQRLQYSQMPYSRLQRFLDNRRALRDNTTASLATMRKNDANIYVQRKIAAGYDGTKTTANHDYIKPNKYTRIAKDTSNSNLASETAAMDTKHVISNYGDYYVSRATRERIKAAKGDKVALSNLSAVDAEYRRSIRGANNFLEYSRAQMTAENDSEADFNFMVGQFLKASTNRVPGADGKVSEEAMRDYRHYIMTSAGGLGETGQTRVLGKIIAKAAAVENSQRRDIAIVAAKFPPDKRSFRNFLFNYYVDDDGYATDKNGNRIEKMRDYLRVNDPDKLVMWDQRDENGSYFDWYDVNGQYVTRIYKKDKAAVKELMSNFDAPINDPINNLLAIHAGIKEQPNSEHPVLRNMGLDGFRTTVGRALLSAPFKEKNAAFSPMVAEMVKKGYIQNYAQEYLAYLDSFNKATKPGAFNTQDADAINMFATMMDPNKWDEIFPTELIRGYRNVNGEPIYGIRRDEAGNKIKVPAEEATREELMERIKEKYIYPSASKIVAMMSRQTQNTMDNQKPGTAAEWKKLKEVFDTNWGEGKTIEIDPYKQDGDMRVITRDIRDAIYTEDSAGNRQSFSGGNRGNRRQRGGQGRDTVPPHINYLARVSEIYDRSLDADEFAINVSEFLYGYSSTAWVADQIQDYIEGEGFGVTKEQLYEKVEELLTYVDID